MAKTKKPETWMSKLAQYLKNKGDVELTADERKLVCTEPRFQDIFIIYGYRNECCLVDGATDFSGYWWTEEVWKQLYDSITSRL